MFKTIAKWTAITVTFTAVALLAGVCVYVGGPAAPVGYMLITAAVYCLAECF